MSRLLRGPVRLIQQLGFPIPKQVYQHLPFIGDMRVECGPSRSFRMHSEGHQIENNVYWEGLSRGHEPATMRVWLKLAAEATVVLDIGANSGLFALAAAAAGAHHVCAFEPLERVRRVAAYNFSLNPDLHIRLEPSAVGASSGRLTIYDPGGAIPSSATLSAEFASAHKAEFSSPGASTYDVDVVSIDAYRRTRNLPRIDLVKIDVEGYEPEVLRGMKEVLSADKPTLILEALGNASPDLAAAIESLEALGYSTTRIEEGPGHKSRNLLCTPERAGRVGRTSVA